MTPLRLANALHGTIAVALALTTACHGESPVTMPRVKVTYMVDTLDADRNAIFKLWRDYLEAGARTETPNPQWSDAEQKQWPVFDLATRQVYNNDGRTHATVFEISPARPDRSEYVIRTLFFRPETTVEYELAGIVRVYAMRENGRWVLASALPRLTESWDRTTFGPITYVHPPGRQVDTARARQAVHFVDSVATAFGAPKPKQITYYLARTPEEVFAIGGVELYIPGSRARAVPANYMVFSGVPSIGEFYAHELTHMVTAPILRDLGTPFLLDEGLALWLGGGREMTYEQAVDELATEMRRNPEWTAERLTEVNQSTFIWRFTAAAVLLAIAHERGGMPMLKAALGAPGDDIVGGVASATGMSGADIERAFRQRVLGGGSSLIGGGPPGQTIGAGPLRRPLPEHMLGPRLR